jgi:hypothetical protein
VIDQNWVDENGNWSCTVTAAERSDVTVFRGRAFQLLNSRLQLSVRDKAPALV